MGTGFIARGLSYCLENDKHFVLSVCLTRRNLSTVVGFDARESCVTNSVERLIDKF